jgi:hypothetical protein
MIPYILLGIVGGFVFWRVTWLLEWILLELRAIRMFSFPHSFIADGEIVNANSEIVKPNGR